MTKTVSRSFSPARSHGPPPIQHDSESDHHPRHEEDEEAADENRHLMHFDPPHDAESLDDVDASSDGVSLETTSGLGTANNTDSMTSSEDGDPPLIAPVAPWRHDPYTNVLPYKPQPIGTLIQEPPADTEVSHTQLIGKVDFFAPPFSSSEEGTAKGFTPQLIRRGEFTSLNWVFLGQVPYNFTRQDLCWLVNIVVGTPTAIFGVERLRRQDLHGTPAAGCWKFAFADLFHASAFVAAHHRLLFDLHGVWFATDNEQRRAFNHFHFRTNGYRNCLPQNFAVVEHAKSAPRLREEHFAPEPKYEDSREASSDETVPSDSVSHIDAE